MVFGCLIRVSPRKMPLKSRALTPESPRRILVAVDEGNISEVEKQLLNEPNSVQTKDQNGKTALHYAASGNRCTIIDLLIHYGCDIDAKDKAGNTPLHVAIENDSIASVETLILRGANTALLNNVQQSALHLATHLNRINVLKIFTKYRDKANVLLPGEHGRTPLHIAAILNHHECARILLNLAHEFCLQRLCDNGCTPVHEAARNSSAETLEVMLQWGEKMHHSGEEMMSYRDYEGNTPLHSAVPGGNIKIVRICLENGARMISEQDDLSTPVHLACSMGLLNIITLMFTSQPEDKAKALTTCDAQKMVPLHYAAMFDHTAVVEYLISEGAGINPVDNERRTPLLLAATRGSWRTVRLLLQLGADLTIKDSSSRNILHYIIMHDGNIEEFSDQMEESKLYQLLNERDNQGCTPLHYASRGGRIRSTQSLIRLGASINMKNNLNESPLHFAARFGRYNTVLELLRKSERGPGIINEPDGKGHTPLHIACENGHKKVVRLLLAKGALLQRDHKGLTPLHLAAKNGYTQTMELLLSIQSHLLDQTDKDGNTALHLAAKENRVGAVTFLLNMNCKLLRNKMNQNPMDIVLLHKHSEAAMAMAIHEQRGYEILQMNSEKSEGIIQGLIALLPEVYIAVLDRCIIRSDEKRDSASYSITYSFKYLQYTREISKQMEFKNKNFRPDPLPAMNTMVQYKRLELLCHPVCQKYIQMKWNAYGMYFHVANLLMYVIFVALLTTFAASLMNTINGSSFEPGKKAAPSLIETLISMQLNSSATFYMNATVVMVFVILNCIKEVLQFYQQRIRYLMDPINLLEWILYITAGIMVYPVFSGHVEPYQLACAATAIFLAWFNFLLYLQRFDRVGIYVVMFLEILKTLIKALLIFSILFIAFGLAFYILLSRGHHLSFSNIPMSFIRVFSMMLGEFDILGTFIQPYFQAHNLGTTLPFPQFSFGFLLLFMISMPILLVNLLIGLAVGDIESVRRNAYLKRLAMQVELHTELERKLPRFILEKVDQEEVVEYPNSQKTSKFTWLRPIFQKWFGSVYTNSSEKLMEFGGCPTADDYICEELYKHRAKLKEISASLENIQTLVRLIVQKMEIATEPSDWDEGLGEASGSKPTTKWISPKFRHKVKTISALLKSRDQVM